jgi:predicted dehydrogenase
MTSRRTFLKQSGIGVAGTIAAMTAPPVHAAGSDEIKIALVGCGGRGGGALMQALETPGAKKLVALADIFETKMPRLRKGAAEKFKDRKDVNVDVPDDFMFTGFDGYKHAIDAVGPGGVVLLATWPNFRPLHFEYAVEKGLHIFSEKSFGVDSPGIRRILKAAEVAKQKNLKVVSGLMSRHVPGLQEMMERIHGGAIGDIVTCWHWRMQGGVSPSPRQEGESLLQYQLRNHNSFTWTNGSMYLDNCVHDLDLCCWAKGSYPVSAQGMGGRQTRNALCDQFDHCAVEYTFADGTRMQTQARFMPNCWNKFCSEIHGTTGSAIMGSGSGRKHPGLRKGYKIWEGNKLTKENVIWEAAKEKFTGGYQEEHNDLFGSIRNDKYRNEAEYSCYATLVGVMGRLAFESGKVITWDEALNWEKPLCPHLDAMTWDSQPPVVPDKDGNYPIAVPGITAVR